MVTRWDRWTIVEWLLVLVIGGICIGLAFDSKAQSSWPDTKIAITGTAPGTGKTLNQALIDGSTGVGEGIAGYVNAAYDWDGDGTAWQTCDCGGGSTPGFTDGWICGFYRASDIDDTSTDYSGTGGGATADAAGNPASCRFEGERVWDDITDDVAALEATLDPGARVRFPKGIYPMKGYEPDDPTLCWDSTAKDFTQTCLLDTGYNGTSSLSAILMRKDGLQFSGASGDTNGEDDLQRTGTWLILDRGLQANFGATPPKTMPRTFCIGFVASQTNTCGSSITGELPAVQLLLDIDAAGPGRHAMCLCNSADCDEVANSSAGWVDALVQDDMLVVHQRTISGQTTRYWARVESIGAVCGAGSEGKWVYLGDTQFLDDGVEGAGVDAVTINSLFKPNDPPGLLYGSNPGETGFGGPFAVAEGPVPIERLVSNLVVEGFTFAHQDWPGSGPCSIAASEAACDQGSLIAMSSGRNNTFRHNVIVHANTKTGSGGALDMSAYNLGAVVERNLWRKNLGASVADISTGAILRNNVFEFNTTIYEDTYLLNNQGGFFKVQDNVFVGNQVDDDSPTAGGLLKIAGPYVYVTGNQFLSSAGPCIGIRASAKHVFITDNIFQCGDRTNTSMRGDIVIAQGNLTSELISHVVISRNHFLPGGFHDTISGGVITDEGHIYFDSWNTADTEDEIGDGGIAITDNMFDMGLAGGSVIGTDDGADLDLGRFFLSGNHLNQGVFCVQATGNPFPACTSLLTCGPNVVGNKVSSAHSGCAPQEVNIPSSADAPATCTVGEIHLVVSTGQANCNVAVANSLCICTTADNWTEAGN